MEECLREIKGTKQVVEDQNLTIIKKRNLFWLNYNYLHECIFFCGPTVPIKKMEMMGLDCETKIAI